METTKNEGNELSEQELRAAHNFIISFKNKIGKENKITAHQIEMHYRNLGIKLTGPRIRAIIHHIREKETIIVNGRKYFLISDSTGYWMSNSKEEIQKYAESLQQRAGSIITIKHAVERYLGIHPIKKSIAANQEKLF